MTRGGRRFLWAHAKERTHLDGQQFLLVQDLDGQSGSWPWTFRLFQP